MGKTKKHRFIINDENEVNIYGFRVLNAGIDIARFNKNPVAFYDHLTTDTLTSSMRMPVGKWSSLTTEGNLFVGYYESDMDDEVGAIIDRKIRNGFINAVSLQFNIHSASFTEDHKLPGQTLPTLAKCEILEISPCGIPANGNAVKLRAQNGVSLTLNSETTTEQIQTIFESINPQQKTTLNEMENSVLIGLLGLSEGASDEDITNAINGLKSDSAALSTAQSNLETANSNLATTNATLTAVRKDRNDILLDDAIEDERITEDMRATWSANLNADFEANKAALLSLSAPVKLLDKLRNEGVPVTQATTVEETQFYKLSMTPEGQAQLAQIQRSDPKTFEALQNEYLTLNA